MINSRSQRHFSKNKKSIKHPAHLQEATMELSLSEKKNACPMFKSKLQELLQKAGHPLPLYESRNEGSDHDPKFRSSVVVGGTHYVSEFTHKYLKVAEQCAAKVAYESVKKINLTPKPGNLHIHQDPCFTKSILHEYAVKMNLGIPKYQTLPDQEGSAKCSFKSSINYCGITYIAVAESKKVAERLAAKEAIQSLLVSDSGTLHQVIYSKQRLYASMFAKMNSVTEGNPGTSMVAVPNTERMETVAAPNTGSRVMAANPNTGSRVMAANPNTGRGIKRKPESKPAEDTQSGAGTSDASAGDQGDASEALIEADISAGDREVRVRRSTRIIKPTEKAKEYWAKKQSK